MPRDKGKIAIGLILFLVLLSFPIWYNAARGKARQRPRLKKPATEKLCIESAVTMRDRHMALLDSWRDDYVRKESTIYVSSDGRKFRKSLTGTCLKCHSEPAEFCDKCHSYAGVDPYCWDCHLQVGQNGKRGQ